MTTNTDPTRSKTEGHQHSKLLAYMIGWGKGSSGGAFTDAQMADPHFRRGWENAREAKQEAYKRACAYYGTELNILRAE